LQSKGRNVEKNFHSNAFRLVHVADFIAYFSRTRVYISIVVT
jgi:hypothetical protein